MKRTETKRGVELKPNGCGPIGFGLFVPDLSFKPSCDLHDVLYQSKITTRLHSDNLFLESMLARASNKFEIIIAIIYYLAVRSFGWIWWRKEVK